MDAFAYACPGADVDADQYAHPYANRRAGSGADLDAFAYANPAANLDADQYARPGADERAFAHADFHAYPYADAHCIGNPAAAHSHTLRTRAALRGYSGGANGSERGR